MVLELYPLSGNPTRPALGAIPIAMNRVLGDKVSLDFQGNDIGAPSSATQLNVSSDASACQVATCHLVFNPTVSTGFQSRDGVCRERLCVLTLTDRS